MKKLGISIILLFVSFSLFAVSNSIVYNYDYNRYCKGEKDTVVGLSFDIHNYKYGFRNQNSKSDVKQDKTGLAFGLEFLERRKAHSFYQNMSIAKDEVSLRYNENVSSLTLRLGWQKDFFWVLGNVPLTVSLGGGVAGRADWVKNNKETYKTAFRFGLSGKASIMWHAFSKSGFGSFFMQYQPDWYLTTNAYSLNNGFSAKSKNFSLNHTVSIGFRVNLVAMTRMINEKHAQKLVKSISTK